MKNIIIFTHGEFSKGILQSAKFIMGNLENVKTLSITLDQNIQDVENMLKTTIDEFGTDQPTLILTDIAGGSTTQIALKVMNDYSNLYVVTGLNLSLLMSLYFLELGEDIETNKAMIRGAIQESQAGMFLLNDTLNVSDDILDDDEL